MACFLVPLTEAVVISAAKAISTKVVAKKTVQTADKKLKLESFIKKVNVLQNMLYGGSFLLAIEHIYHGEVSFIPPFLTAMKTPEEVPMMLHEMATVGVGMAVLVTAVWGIGVGIFSLVKKFSGKSLTGEIA